jgi:hypothetical protein
MQDQSEAASAAEPNSIKGAAKMAYGDELMYELWRAPRVLVMACLAPFAVFCLWAVVLFLLNLPMSWNYAIQHPGVAAQEISRFVIGYSVSWLPFSVPLFFLFRQLTWLRHRFGAGRNGISYEVTEVGIVSVYDEGFAITMPWAITKCLVKTKRLLLLRSKRGWWYLPWRALSTVDQERLWAYARTRIATASKPTKPPKPTR